MEAPLNVHLQQHPQLPVGLPQYPKYPKEL